MHGVESYLFLLALIYVINVIPAFMPPTWIILSFLYIHNHLLFVPTILLGVIAATLGRITLAVITKRGLLQFLTPKFITNYQNLGSYLKQKRKLTIPVVFGYAFSPISSNSLFIMAGLANLNLKIIAISFFLGRIVTYSFWVAASHELSLRLEDIFASHFTNIGTVISTVIGMVLIIVIGEIKWDRVFKFFRKT